MNADGSGAALLSAGGEACPVGLFHPNWSPDGTKLAVVCYPGGPTESLAIMEVATKAVHRLYTVDHPQAIDNQPTWSPDGKTIAFDIIQRDPSDTDVIGWTVAVGPAAGGEVRKITDPTAFLGYPDWSPDGRTILLGARDIHNMPGGSDPSNLFTVKPDGTGLRQLTHSSVDGTLRIGQARWSSDGTRILVSVALSEPNASDFSDAQIGFVASGGGEPVLFRTTIHGSRPDLRPTP
jgi:Tol biopolymer transport system component